MLNSHSMRPPRFSFFFVLIALLSGLALAVVQWAIYKYAPVEASLGLAQKLFYLHVPFAWWGLFSFLLVCAASIAYLCTKNRTWDSLAGTAGEIGVLFSLLGIVTGSFWARSSWNVWWIWDPRLITTLIMCFLYAGYLIIRGMDLPPARKASVCAVIGIVAFLDVPLVYISARLWSFVHPPSVTLTSEMRLTLLISIASIGLFWVTLTALRFSLYQAERFLAAFRMQLEHTNRIP